MTTEYTTLTAPEIWDQAPSESRYRAMNFLHDLLPGESLVSVSGVAIVSPIIVGDTLAISQIAINGTRVVCLITGGTAGILYLLSFTVITNVPNTKIAYGRLNMSLS